MAKLPKPDLKLVGAVDPEIVERVEPLWRIHQAVGPHTLAWNALREYGPLDSARFDPWPPPEQGRDSGVGYFGFEWATCLAEVFATKRQVDLTQPGKQLSGLVPIRALRLLDLTTGYPILVGASHKINSGPKDVCRKWAVAFTTTFPDLDGMLYTGMAGRDCVVLFDPARDAFGSAPSFSRTLEDRVVRDRVVQAAKGINYDVLA